jgi:hypothetical protein
MNVPFSLLTGFATAFIGITPGLLNMTAREFEGR